MIIVRVLGRADEPAAAALLDAELGGRQQARLGEVIDVLACAGFGAFVADRLVGVATYAVQEDEAEVVALAVASERRRQGIGARLIEAVRGAAEAEGACELWLVTTNDNLDALRLYQRRGFRLTALHAGAVEASRALKPSIPLVGAYGIPLRDELVLSLGLLAT